MTLEKCVKSLLVKEPFYGLFLLGLNRYFTDKVQTAAVGINGINCELMINEKFWNELSDEEQTGVLLHEVGHLLYNHLFMGKDFANHRRFNIAADCTVNENIPVLQKDPYVWPARFGLPDSKGTKYYYENLPESQKGKKGSAIGSGDGNGEGNGDDNDSDQQTFDDHSEWEKVGNLSEAEKKLIKNQIDSIAKNTAEQIMKQCGKIPGQFKEYIDSLFEVKPQIFNWKAYFRRVIGNLITSEIKLTKMRPSRRFPDARGIKMKRKPSVLVGVDTSGSVSNDELLDFFSEINHLWKSGVSVTIAEIDTQINRIYEYKGHFDGEINGRGGTMMDDLFIHFLENKNKYSTLVLFTDGFFNINTHNVQNMVWVLTSNYCQQNYPGITIKIPKENK